MDDEYALLLDFLVNANPNRKYYDRDVCRLYLVGLCPHELFQSTEMDMGRCLKVHSLQLRKEYEEAKSKGIDNYERELEAVINKLIVECDVRIGRVLKPLDEEDSVPAIETSVSEATETPEVLELSEEIKEKLKEADKYDLEGLSDMRIQALKIVEELRIKRADKLSKIVFDLFKEDMPYYRRPLPNPPPFAPLPVVTLDARTQEMIKEKFKEAKDLCKQGLIDEARKALEEAETLKKLPFRQELAQMTKEELRVCDICGVFLSVYDSDRRLADHFGGKLHLGYMQIREKLDELQEERNKRLKTDQDRDRDSSRPYNLRSRRRSQSRAF